MKKLALIFGLLIAAIVLSGQAFADDSPAAVQDGCSWKMAGDDAGIASIETLTDDASDEETPPEDEELPPEDEEAPPEDEEAPPEDEPTPSQD